MSKNYEIYSEFPFLLGYQEAQRLVIVTLLCLVLTSINSFISSGVQMLLL